MSKEHKNIFFMDDYVEGCHYYENHFEDGRISGNLWLVEIYDENDTRWVNPIYKASFVDNTNNYYQLVSFESPKINGYVHNEVDLGGFMVIRYKE
jgi:hypothetical protein